MGMLKDFIYHTPTTLKEALGLLKKAKEPLVLGGGTFSLNYLKKTPKYPSDIIGLKKIPALRGIRDEKKSVFVGAMTTIAEMAESPLIGRLFPSLAQASAQLATTPIRHMATVGGNVASRFFWADLPAVLISLDARLSYVTPAGGATVESVPILDFLKERPSKKCIVTKITLPKGNPHSFYFRHTRTMEVDTPSAALAFAASLEGSRLRGVRLVVNTTLSFPVVLLETRDVFEGRLISEISLEKAQDALKRDLSMSKLDEYRIHTLSQDLDSLCGSLQGLVR